MRQSATETLRQQVKQVSLGVDAACEIPKPSGLLDARRHGERVIATIDNAPSFIEQLEAAGTPHYVTELSLDEIERTRLE